jgi:hypothetical protein
MSDEPYPLLQIAMLPKRGGDPVLVSWQPGDRLSLLAGLVLEKNHPLPVTQGELRDLARHLGTEPTTEFEFAVQDAIVSYGILMVRGWWAPRRIKNFYELLIRDPAAAAEKYRGDIFARLLRKELLDRAGISLLDPTTEIAGRERLLAVLRAAHADICELIRAGQSDARPEQLFLQQVVLIARKFGCDLKLPSRDPGRGGARSTPLYRFAVAMRDLLARHGPEILSNRDPRFERLASLRRRTLLAGLERAKRNSP